MSDETQADVPDVEVEVEFASAVLGRERGAREVLTRSPYLDAVIAEGHVRVVREITVPTPPPPPPLVVAEPELDAEPEKSLTGSGRKRAGRGEG